MERARETGLPVLRPMCSAFQQDAACYDEGVDFMKVEIYAGSQCGGKRCRCARRLLCRKGAVLQYYTGEVCTRGGQTVDSGHDRASLFIRGSSPPNENQMKNLAAETATGIDSLLSRQRL